jgi:hypothetical protein
MANKLFNENVAITMQLTSQLPKNRDLLRKVREYGMQPV